MLGYSGYVEHSDFYIRPQSYEDAFNFLCQLAEESGESTFYIGKAKPNGYDFDLESVTEVVFDGYDWVKGK